ncbi:MAG: D-alanine--D-alanine ligase A [Epulopiscium sp. Nele67-Bin005]|nr:MAG: D-alanine--D-alanine ligase A [Epulopiscium sp. Nele67-Bin005]
MKQNVLILFGGQSQEHEVSLKSVTTICNNIDTTQYDIYPVGITKEGEWLFYRGANFDFTRNDWEDKGVPCILNPAAKNGGLMLIREPDEIVKIRIDKVFPVLHGPYGEDGTIQGLCKLAQLPFVGCGILSSAVSMDKAFTKIIVNSVGVPQADFVIVRNSEMSNVKQVVAKIEEHMPYPYFIKPANAGSSVGVSKAHNERELVKGLEEALKHDTKVLVEETIIGREVETAVLGNENLKVSGVGEILAAAEFYDYDAKYNNQSSETIISADLPSDVKEQIRQYAKTIFRAVEGKGLSRIDFFVTEDNQVIFNEINTLPGFTSISMYPMLFEATGINISELVTQLIELASL